MWIIILFAVFSTVNLSVSVRGNYTLSSSDNGFLNKYVSANSTIIYERSIPQTRFEDDTERNEDRRQYGLIKFEEQSGQKFRFEDDINEAIPLVDTRPQDIKFQEGFDFNLDNQIGYGYGDDNKTEEQKPDKKKKRRRRRRKPRYQLPGYPGFQNPGGVYQSSPSQAGYPVNPGLLPQFQGQGQYPYPYPNPGFTGQYFNRPKRPRPSAASQALSAITNALGSIALYDDYQCVPRLLCEAAGGGNLGSGVLQSVGGLQPLLTLLAAYNGISSSPLFVFGRAVLLGMTSKGNTGTCRYAYSQCPTDPEQLVHYLNNHNGGFFRFFNAPQLSNPQQQNIQQFYNQLSVPQQYGFYQPNLNLVDNYGIYKPLYPEQHYGLHQPENFGPGHQNYGFQQNPNYGLQGSNNLYHNNIVPQNYGPNYPHNIKNGFNRIRFKNNDEIIENNAIQKRILNSPDKGFKYDIDSNDENPKWAFPSNDINVNNIKNNNDYVRGSKALKFPESDDNLQYNEHNYYTQETYRKGKGFNFPDSQNSVKYVDYYVVPPINYINNNNANYHSTYTGSVSNDYVPIASDNEYNRDKYLESDANYNGNSNDGDGLRTVYIVRGNGDPNHPEIVKVRPGQSIQ